MVQSLLAQLRPTLLLIATRAGTIALIVVGAYLADRAARAAVLRMEKLVEDEDHETVSEREKRARTLGAVLRKAATGAIWSVAAIMVLGELNVDIAPIITAAGIGGLALSFGAQNLVRDVIGGFFLLFENQVHVGDVVKIGDVSGLVESINLRTIVLRDLSGVVHTIPNGAIQSISNMTREWSRYVVDVGVAYREDVDRVIAVLREVGDELAADPAYARHIVKPLEVLGVDDFRPSEVVIRTLITTAPLRQWEVGRELRRRIKKAFDAHGIEFPFPHTTVYWGEASRPFQVQVQSAAPSGADSAANVQREAGASADRRG